MSYIGTQPAIGQYRQLDNIAASFNGVTTTFTTSVGGQNVTAGSAQQLLVSLGGVIQQPNVNYTTSTNSITFATAPAAGLTFFAVLMGDTLNTGTPSDGTVTTAKLANNSVTTAKLDSAGIAPVVTSLNGGPLAGARNRIINGDMRIDARNAGASVTATSGGVFVVDRWDVTEDTDGTMTAQQSSVAPSGFTSSVLVTTTSADASLGASQYAMLSQRIEGLNVSDLAWGTASAQPVVLSFWARSSLTGTFGGALRNSAADRSYPFTYAISAANTWELKTVAIPGDTTGTWLGTNGIGIRLTFGLGVGSSLSGTAGAWAASNVISTTGATSVVGTNGATFYLTGVQLEPGTVATPFERINYTQALQQCQRYFCKSFNIETAPQGGTAGTGDGEHQINVLSTGDPQIVVYWPVVMRATPSVTLYNPRVGGAAGQWSTNLSDSANARAFGVTPIKTVIDNTDVSLSVTYWGIAWAASAEL